MDAILTDLKEFFAANMTVILRVVLILGFAWLTIRIMHIAEKRFTKSIKARFKEEAQQSRLTTLLSAGTGFLRVVIIGGAALMVLISLGIDIAPILASAGVVGLAITLGAQTLIKDYLGGVLILFENTFKVGEVIELEGLVGTVERIELRTTQLRDFTGKLITVPNGDIRILSNNSRDWSRAVVDLNLSVEADLVQAVTALQAAALLAAEDEALKPLLLETPQIAGWNNLSEWGVQVRVTAKTLPGKQVEAAAILRQVTLGALQAANIPLAAPPIPGLPAGKK
jgi:small conductance mechanosensitive channel